MDGKRKVIANNPFAGIIRIRFVGYDLSPSGRAPLCSYYRQRYKKRLENGNESSDLIFFEAGLEHELVDINSNDKSILISITKDKRCKIFAPQTESKISVLPEE